MTGDPAKLPSLLERALAIRRHILPLLRANGTITKAGEMRLLMWHTEPWRFAFRMDRPSPPIVQRGKPQAYQAAAIRQDIRDKHGGANLEHALDIWHGPKVFLIEWDAETSDRLNIALFQEGPWEANLLTLGRRASST